MGLRKFSMYNPNILSVKNVILNTNIAKVTPIVNKILKTENMERIEDFVQKLNSDLNLY
jgi:phosphoenolpyruvate-protein kinase (PTS system EI component)